MPQFEMNGGHLPEFRALSEFAQGYIEALFFTEEETGSVRVSEDGFFQVWNPETDSSLPGDCGFADFDPESLKRIVADCDAFQARVPALLESAYERGLTGAGYDATQAGRDFWFTRNGHGVGYRDRDFADGEGATGEALGRALSEASKRFGESNVYFGDDEKVYVS